MADKGLVGVREGLEFTIRCRVDRESNVIKGRWVIENELDLELYLDEIQVQQAYHKATLDSR